VVVVVESLPDIGLLDESLDSLRVERPLQPWLFDGNFDISPFPCHGRPKDVGVAALSDHVPADYLVVRQFQRGYSGHMFRWPAGSQPMHVWACLFKCI